MLKLTLPWVDGRGAGLGNELVPWCRAYIAAQVLGARCLPPAFGLNARQYGRHFGTSRLDWLAYRGLRTLMPHVEFTEADYLAHGGGDVSRALRSFGAAAGLPSRSAWLLTTRGMWGGMAHIAAARDFALSTLHQSRFAARNLMTVWQRLQPDLPVVGLHVRMGDFGAPMDPEAYQGRFNVALPPAWYRHVAVSIHEQMNGHVQFLLVSDAPADRLNPIAEGLRCVFTADIPDSDCSDLLALARCDLLVCAVSSYSVWAAFLSEAPYLWYGPNLTLHTGGWGSIWGHEEGQRQPAAPTLMLLEKAQADPGRLRPRAWAVPNDGDVPAEAIIAAEHRYLARSNDLVRYGVVQAPPNTRDATHA